MAKSRRHAADRLLGRAAGTDLPDLTEEEVLWPIGDSSRWRRADPDRASCDGEVDRCARPAVASSAPVEVPVWPSFLRDRPSGRAEIEEEEPTKGDWMPPHEYLARSKGRSVAMSVMEGAGRTLKGRDMSRVRDAVWSWTGFNG
ncbi:uncharacterized protein LOC122050885 [Zingiber officinale]|uniref:Senescence regulator n=1 Tax=Zingiber officinale TaxID=94328 RepID=A0A8J5HF65_ZINOF|nr:uncharacterized protein LOC122050885 [Zingiber officinale]KAG6522971.1 hypothetical protein ZIOFF_020128 [Zingiber officinale]